MLEHAKNKCAAFQNQLDRAGIHTAIVTDEASIAYLAGFWGYLGIEFGRPTFLILRTGHDPIVVTPLMESEMVAKMTWVPDVRTWEDAGQNRWENVLAGILGADPKNVGIERGSIPALVRAWFDDQHPEMGFTDITPSLNSLRMIKSPEEIVVMRQAGKIAGAMMAAAEDALGEGIPEYEAALAVMNAGTRAAAGFLTDKGWDAFISPMIHNLQIMQSGADTSMVHRRASVKAFERGDPVYFCFCNMAQFRQYKLGFDRMFFVNEVRDDAAHIQEVAIAAQQAAIAAIKPGVTAQSVAEAADTVYSAHGFATGYRTGRSIGMAYLEAPELKHGDKTILEAGMTFAVDGGISVDGKLAGRIGDSIVVTETGSEYLTQYPRKLLVTS